VIAVDNGVMPAEQMQVTITKPIEDAVNSVPGLVTVRSTTSRGSAEVSLFFTWNVDMFRTLQLVDAAIAKVRQTLPPTVAITTNRLTFATFPILGYSLTSERLTQTQLWELANYELKPPLNRVEGVSTVAVQGGKVPEFHIVPDMARMQTAGVTILDLVNAVQASNIVDSPGLYEAGHHLVLALIGSQAHDAEQLGKLVVKTTMGGVGVRVSDVATVQPGILPVYTTVTADNKSAVLVNISRQPSSNTVAVADAVAVEVDKLKKTLPAGVQLKPYYDQSELVRDSIASVRDAVLIGLLLACLILFLFLRDWNSSLVAGLVIPATLAITVVCICTQGCAGLRFRMALVRAQEANACRPFSVVWRYSSTATPLSGKGQRLLSRGSILWIRTSSFSVPRPSTGTICAPRRSKIRPTHRARLRGNPHCLHQTADPVHFPPKQLRFPRC